MITQQTLFRKHEILSQCWLMLVHRVRRWPNIKPTLAQCLVAPGAHLMDNNSCTAGTLYTLPATFERNHLRFMHYFPV